MKARKSLMAIATLGFAAAAVGGAFALRPVSASALQTTTLNGFTTPGASVNVTEKQMRFEINLSAAAVTDRGYADELAAKTLESGVIVVPYDLYVAQGLTELTVDTAIAAKADVSSLWEQDGDVWKSYAFLSADLIPEGQENRVLVARGYIVDGENVYYTNEVKSSMAYVAWQNLASFPNDQALLKSYMGPYTLTYGDGQQISNLYYGDEVTALPTEIDGVPVEGWFWDEGLTDDIAAGDYATGSMRIYYKLASADVSGKLTCANNIALEEATFTVDGQAVQAEVDAQGNFSFKAAPGAHTFVVRAGGHKGVVTQTLTAGETNNLNVTLLDAKYEVGSFGKIASTTGYLRDENDFDGTYTVTDGNNYALIMPNTATTDAFEFNVKVSGVVRGSDEMAYGIGITDGTSILSFNLYRWEPIKVNLIAPREDKGWEHGNAYQACYDHKGQSGYLDRTLKLVVTDTKISFYVGETLYMSVTENGVTELGANVARLTNYTNTIHDAEPLALIKNFFAADANLACVVTGISGNQSPKTITATYECSQQKYATVTGTIAENNALDLTKTTLKVDGVACDMTVAADGSFTAYVPAGTHTFAFANGRWGDTVENVTVLEGANNDPINVTLEDQTYAVGNFKSVSTKKPTTYTETAKGVFNVSGKNYMILMPNTATTGDFEFTVSVSGVSYSGDEGSFGLVVSNGSTAISFNFWKWRTRVNISNKVGNGHQVDFTHKAIGNSKAATLKMVRSGETLSVYMGGVLITTLSATGHEGGTASGSWTGGDGLMSTAGLAALSSFFTAGAEYCVGLASMTGNASQYATVTYSCVFADVVA